MDLKKNTLLNGSAYALAMLGTIVGGMYEERTLVYICKPAMLLILSSWFFFNSRRVGDRFTLLIQVGLFFSLIGDIALMFDDRDTFYFLVGLGAFMIAQLCYALAFALNVSDAGPGGNVLVPVVLSTGIMAYGFFFAYDLMPYVEEVVALPVIIYACAITLMGIGAACRFSRTYTRSFLLILVGSVFFIASDSVLAVDHFMKPLDHAQWSIMLTYAIAQFMISAGALAHVLDPEEIRRKAALST